MWRWLGICLLFWSSLTGAAGSVPVPTLNMAVTDLTQTLTAEQVATLEQQLRDFSMRKGSQLAILIVPSTQPETIEQYSIRVVDQWQLGREKTDDGVLLLIAKNDRAVRIEVGDGLEGAITDAVASRIIRQRIVPQFQSDNYYQGISDATTRLMQLIEGEALPETEPESSNNLSRFENVPWPLLLFVVFAGGGVLRGIFGRMGAAGLTSGAVGLLIWLFMGSLLFALLAAVFAFVFVLGSGGNGGGWSSGPRGGWRGGSGGWGGGGFRGGGGGFSGGGASGRW